MLADRPELGLIQPRVVDPTGVVSPRRWIPRIRKGDPAHSSNVFSCWEGAVLMPRGVRRDRRLGRPVLLRARGHRARVAGLGHRPRRLVRGRPRGGASGHRPGQARVLLPPQRPEPGLARRRDLPAVLVPLYVGSWTAIQVLRWARNPSALRRGSAAGAPAGARSGGAAPHVVAHGVAHDPRGALRRPTDRLSVGCPAMGRPLSAPSLPLDGGIAERRAACRQAGQGHHVVAARAAGAAEEARRAAAARAAPLPRRRVLRRRQGQPLPAAPVVQAARGAREAHPVLILSRASGSALALLEESRCRWPTCGGWSTSSR